MTRMLFVTFVCLAAAGKVSAQTAFLAEANLRDACFQIDLTMQLKGTLSVLQAGQPLTFARTAVAEHQYLERILDAKETHAERGARFYNRADAAITDDKDTFKIHLRGKHQSLVAHRLKDQLVVYHASEPLSREEVEVVGHLDSLAVTGLLPRKELKAGETWSVPRDVAQALCDLDAIEKCDLTGTLDKIEGDFAYLSFRGLVEGIDLAAPVKLMIKDSTAAFNLKLKRLTLLNWKLTDQRQQGPVSPGLSADIAFTLKRVPIDPPEVLGDIALVKVPSGPPPAHLTNVLYRNKRKGFELQFSRDWNVVSQTDDGKLVLRLIDPRGEFISQATVTPWQKVSEGNQLKLADFAKMMRESKGWAQRDGEPLELTDKIKSTNGYSIYRMTANGKLGGVDAVRSFYLVATPTGEQVLLDFSMLPNQASKLDGRDLTLVQSLQFLSTTIEAIPASRPTP